VPFRHLVFVAAATVTYLALVEAESASSFVDAHVRQP
jgi:hypothetical protein